jgi:serine/threonine protein kinase
MTKPPNPRLGEFELRGMLGHGGSGTVYAAVDGEGREIALKVLNEDLSLSDRERGRFIDEANRMRRVRHEGLIALSGSGELPDGRPYISMPLLRGETLQARLQRGRLDVGDALAVFDALAQALGALHAAGLLHRDIKPSNVFLLEGDSALSPVLLDFGVAREVSDAAGTTTVEGRVRGTPAYMAPERLFGTGATVRSDVYELAVTLYLMLVGRRPWDKEHDAESRLNPRTPEDAGVALPGDLSTCLLRALSTRPDHRPRGPLEFALEVREALTRPGQEDRRTVTLDIARPPLLSNATTERSSPRRRLRPVPIAIVSAAAAAVAIAGVAAHGASASSRAASVALDMSSASPSALEQPPVVPPPAPTAVVPLEPATAPVSSAAPHIKGVAPRKVPPAAPPSAQHYYSYRK